ncbi:MAG: choice-of-anchor Q domain-containing protein, partial [Rhodanobacteraceae bacterium]
VTGDHDAIMTSNIALPPDTIVDDPLLLPLADNGGPTLTHALDPSSVALDAGSNPDALVNDQRGAGFARVVGAGADIGAFEAAPADAIFTNGFD